MLTRQFSRRVALAGFAPLFQSAAGRRSHARRPVLFTSPLVVKFTIFVSCERVVGADPKGWNATLLNQFVNRPQINSQELGQRSGRPRLFAIDTRDQDSKMVPS